MKHITLADGIYYIGVNDRKKNLFENNWPIPNGVTYNSYLIKDEKSALIDTIEFGSDSGYLNRISEILDGRPLDYIIVNHVEPDHSSMINSVRERFPQVKVVGNKQTQKLLKGFYNLPDESFHMVADGDELSLGANTLRFTLIPWVHWPETMVSYNVENKIIFTCDAFGGFGTLDGGIFDDQNDFDGYYLDDMRRYYSNIVGKYCSFVQKAFAKLKTLDIKTIAPAHGIVWRTRPEIPLGLYDKWSSYKSEDGVVIAYASMYGNTEHIADYLGRLLGERGLKVRTFDVSKTHVSFMISEIWKYKGLILGSCAYNAEMHPMMAHLCNELKIVGIKQKTVSLFGSSCWNGAGSKCLGKWAEEMKIEPASATFDINGTPTPEKLEAAAEKFVDEFMEKYNA